MMEDGRGRRTEGGGGDIDRILMSFGIEISFGFGVRRSFRAPGRELLVM